MTTEPRWLTVEMVIAIHDEQLALFGGGEGLRDRGLLESALAKPLNRFAYEKDSDISRLAAAYCYGIVRNHPFVDGNKRTGLLAANAFLALNGSRFNPDQADEVAVILRLADGSLEEDALARWIGDNSQPR